MFFFFFKQKTAYEMRISDWSSDVCSSDLISSLPEESAVGSVQSALTSSAVRMLQLSPQSSTAETVPASAPTIAPSCPANIDGGDSGGCTPSARNISANLSPVRIGLNTNVPSGPSPTASPSQLLTLHPLTITAPPYTIT